MAVLVEIAPWYACEMIRRQAIVSYNPFFVYHNCGHAIWRNNSWLLNVFCSVHIVSSSCSCNVVIVICKKSYEMSLLVGSHSCIMG